jgi:hypothetical protein
MCWEFIRLAGKIELFIGGSRWPTYPKGMAMFGRRRSVVDGEGHVLARARLEDGERVIVADVTPGRRAPQEALGAGFWTPDMPARFDFMWRAFNWHARREYSSMQRRAAGECEPPRGSTRDD